MPKRIAIKVKTELHVPLQDLNFFQGELKSLSETDYLRLRGEILKGLTYAKHVWKHEGKWYILDGHQTVRVLRRLVEEGWEAPSVPCVEVKAASYKEAREIVLQGVSQYGKVTEEGLYEFLDQSGIAFESYAERFNAPGIDNDHMYQSYYVDIPAVDPGESLGGQDGTSTKEQVASSARGEARGRFVFYFDEHDYLDLAKKMAAVGRIRGSRNSSELFAQIINEVYDASQVSED